MNATTKTVVTLASLASNFALGTAALRLSSNGNAAEQAPLSAATIVSRITALEREVAAANAIIATYDTEDVVAAAEAENTKELEEIAGWLQNGVGESAEGMMMAALLAQSSFDRRDGKNRDAGVAAADAEHTKNMDEILGLLQNGVAESAAGTTMAAILAQNSMDERDRKTRAWYAANSRLDAAKAQLQVLCAQLARLQPEEIVQPVMPAGVSC